MRDTFEVITIDSGIMQGIKNKGSNELFGSILFASPLFVTLEKSLFMFISVNSEMDAEEGTASSLLYCTSFERLQMLSIITANKPWAKFYTIIHVDVSCKVLLESIPL